MADRVKRPRQAVEKPAEVAAPAKAPKQPPAHLLGRPCRVRLVLESDAWLTGTLKAYSGNHKQTCEIELDGGADANSANAPPKRVEKVHLSNQPVHVLDEVVWGAEGGASSPEGKAAAKAGGGRRADDARGGPGSLGAYVDGLVPMLLFTAIGPPAFRSE